MAYKVHSISDGRAGSKRKASRETAKQQDETRRKRGRQADSQESSNHAMHPPREVFPETIIDLTGSDDDGDILMVLDNETSPGLTPNDVHKNDEHVAYDTCFGLVRCSWAPLEGLSPGCGPVTVR